MAPKSISKRLFNRMTALLQPVKEFKKVETKELITNMRKSAMIVIHPMESAPVKESYTYDEMMAIPGIYLAEGFKDVKMCVIKQASGEHYGLYVHENGHVEPLTPEFWKDTKFYEANDDLMIIFARTV